MKNSLRFALLFSLTPAMSFALNGQTIPIDSLYLGQIPPGNIPNLFRLPISSGLFAAERIAVSSDGKEIYFSELNNYPPTTMRIKYFKYLNDHWNGPFVLFEGYNAPGLSLGGDTLFIEKLQNGASTPYVYVSVRTDTGWGVPFEFMPANQSYKHYLQFTNSGNFYLSANPSGSIGGLDWCKLITNNTDTTIQTLGLPLNTSGNDADFYIARDESFMILSSFPSATRSCNGYLDLFIAYRKSDNTWTNPKNLGTAINVMNPSDGRWGPYVTTDKKYLLYSRGITPSDGGINWVRIDNLIDSLKHTNYVPYLKSQILNQTDTIGRSFSYQIPDSIFVDDDGNNTLHYTATLRNGGPLPAWLSFDAITKTFSGIPTIPGTSTIKVIAKDTANANVSCQFTITVANATSVQQEKGQVPTESQLLQNYPNPFNPSTIIEYDLPKDSRVKITVFDMLGRQVRTLIDEEKSGGSYKVEFNADNLSSGVYFYHLQTNDFTQTKKLVLMR